VKKTALLLLCSALFLFSCRLDPNAPDSARNAAFFFGISGSFVPEPGRGDVPDFEREVFILNGLAETMSILNLSEIQEIEDPAGAFYNNVMILGVWPNDLYIYDNNLFVLNSGDNKISVYEETSLDYAGSIDLGNNSNPMAIVPAGSSSIALVPEFIRGSVAIVNLDTFSLVARIEEVGTGLMAGVYVEGSPDKGYICSSAYNSQTGKFDAGKVIVIDIDNRTVLSTISLEDGDYDSETDSGSNPTSIVAFPGLNEVHVACAGTTLGSAADNDNGKIIIINTSTDSVAATLDIGGSPSFNSGSIDSGNSIAYLSGVGGVQSYNYTTREVLHGSTGLPGSSGGYIITDDANDSPFFSGIVYDGVENVLVVCYFSADSIILLNGSEPYDVIAEIEGSDGAQIPFLFAE
jgi:hypothetical protein